ncbi:MAG: alpha/beta hydrolase [bacterium]
MTRPFFSTALLLTITSTTVMAQGATLPPLPAALGAPKPGPVTSAPYAPQPIVQGGIVVPLYPPNSPYLKSDRVREAEVYNMSQAVPGRINSIVNIHNPSIEFHAVDRGLNTGAVVILVAGGGHNSLNVGGEAADFVPFFYNYGVNTVILRNRLRRDGYDAQVDAVNDAQQAIRMVRAYATPWNIDPNKIGIMGFSAGAELAAPSAISFGDFDRKNSAPTDPLSGISSRPDFVGIIYPGPTPFSARNPTGPSSVWGRNPTPPSIPRNAPPAFLATAGSGDRIHALWAMDYANAMLDASVPNVELHVYGNGRHPGDSLSDGSRMSGGLTDRNAMPMGTWQHRFIDWFRDLGFLQKPGVETKAAKDVATFARTRVSGSAAP